MKHRNWMRAVVLTLSVSVLYFCSANPLDPDTESDVSLTKGIPADQINWAGWNPEVTTALEEVQDNDLARRSRGYESKRIHNHSGGHVGGRKTFGNRVDVPENAFEQHILNMSVRVLHLDRSGQTAAGVEFLPSRHYDADMQITLSWAFLDVEGDEWENLNLQPYYSEDLGSTWFPVEGFTVDPDAKTIYFNIDHVTRYGWGLDEDD
mgnify:CR=1 FL=1